MKSMTGHGRAKVTHAGRQITVELSTVNRKQFELTCSLPRGWQNLETKVRDTLAVMISRGRINCSVTVLASVKAAPKRMRIDQHAARTYYLELETLRKKLKITEPISLDTVLRGPGIFTEEAGTETTEEAWPVLESALKKALRQLMKMREAEGRHLAEDFGKRLVALDSAVKKIAQRAPLVVERYRGQLRQRIAQAGVEWRADDERLIKEVVVYADRSDITEELTRLESHGKQFRILLREASAVGRTLEFLTQEIHREVNTIGAKANDWEISQQVMFLKGELEKMREQMQNVE